MNIPYAAAISLATGHFFNRNIKWLNAFSGYFEMTRIIDFEGLFRYAPVYSNAGAGNAFMRTANKSATILEVVRGLSPV